MSYRLADEVLKDILTPSLLVPDNLFADSGPLTVSPFSRATHSSSHVLLVCKRWMRIGTPALYTTVVVRSMPQARALALAMTNNPEFGHYTRKLRIEGAYGSYILTAVRQMPNIRDLCMTLGVYSNVSMNGTLDALEMINPERVILTLAPSNASKSANYYALVETLTDQIRTWPRLRTFVFASSQIKHLEANYYRRYRGVFDALVEAPVLAEIHLTTFEAHLPWCLKDTLEKKKGLVVRFQRNSVEQIPALVGMRTRLPPELHNRVIFDGEEPNPTAPIIAQHNPFYKPFSNVDTKTRRNLLSRIVSFALVPTKVQAPWLQDALWYDINRFNCEAIPALFGASPEMRELALEQLVEHIAFNPTPAVLQDILKLIIAHPSLAAKTRTLQIRTFPSDLYSSITPDLQLQAQAQLVTLLPNLCEAAIGCAQEVLQALHISGSTATLEKLTLWGAKNLFAPATFNVATFTALGHLMLDADNVTLETISGKSRIRSLPLQHLSVRSGASTFFDGLAKFELPNWTSLMTQMFNHDAMRKFFTKRGRTVYTARLLVVDSWLWKLLLSLEFLELDNPYPYAEPPTVAFAKARHKNLRVLKFHMPVESKPGVGIHLILWEQLLCRSITRARFPALKEIHLLQPVNLWPTTEREITKSMWPLIAELLEERDISLLNFEGRRWRKRLQ